MTKEVQIVGGTRSQQDTYVGPIRELTADITNWDLRLHDGVTPGGHPILSRDNNDQRYQGRSPELDGFNFEPQQRGWLVRRGPANYVLRKLGVTDELTLANEDGYAGNPTLGLAATLSGDHTFEGSITFEEPIIASGGVTGAITGNIVGNVTGNLTGDVTGDVTGDLQGNTFGTHTGGLDIRGADLQLDNSQIPTTAISGLAAFVKANAVPVGIISMWSGDSSDIPSGWVLCDGQNATPNLVNLFVIGAGLNGSAVAAHDFGGAEEHDHSVTTESAGEHNHVVTVQGHALTLSEMPAHNHANGVTDKSNPSNLFNHGTIAADPGTSDSIDNNGSNGNYEGLTSEEGDSAPHTHAATTANAGAHTHVGESNTVSHLPPYYALCYIMRVPD